MLYKASRGVEKKHKTQRDGMGDALVGAVFVDWLIHTVHREVTAITTSMFSQNLKFVFTHISRIKLQNN